MNPEPDLPQEWAERFARGDDRAVTEVYRRYYRPMLNAAYGVLGDREMAAEAAQQAFVQAWRACRTFDPRMRLSPWLYAIVRRTAIDVYRRGRRLASEVPLDLLADGVVVVDAPSLDRVWTIFQVRRALARMPAEEAEVLRLAYFHGLTHTEISTRARIPLGTVKSRSARAQRRLAKMLAHLAEPAVTASSCGGSPRNGAGTAQAAPGRRRTSP